MRLFAFAALLSIAAAAPACAGTVITGQIVTPSMSGKHMLYLEADRLRAESPRSVVIFDAAQNTAYLLDPTAKTFVRQTAESLQRTAAVLEAARKRLLSSPAFAQRLPPAERARIESMFAGEPPKIELRDAGSKTHFGKWSCERVDELRNGAVVASLCVASLAELGLTEADLGCLPRFLSFFGKAVPPGFGGFPRQDPQAIEKLVGYAAMPVDVKVAAAKFETTVETVEKKPLSPGLFAVPRDYRETVKLRPQ